MTTQLTKPVSRRAEEGRRDRGKFRRYVITLSPGGLIGIRLEGTRKTEQVPVAIAYDVGVRLRVASERAGKKKSKLVKRGKL